VYWFSRKVPFILVRF